MREKELDEIAVAQAPAKEDIKKGLKFLERIAVDLLWPILKPVIQAAVKRGLIALAEKLGIKIEVK